jgi:hypothetical protein
MKDSIFEMWTIIILAGVDSNGWENLIGISFSKSDLSFGIHFLNKNISVKTNFNYNTLII